MELMNWENIYFAISIKNDLPKSTFGFFETANYDLLFFNT